MHVKAQAFATLLSCGSVVVEADVEKLKGVEPGSIPGMRVSFEFSEVQSVKDGDSLSVVFRDGDQEYRCTVPWDAVVRVYSHAAEWSDRGFGRQDLRVLDGGGEETLPRKDHLKLVS